MKDADQSPIDKAMLHPGLYVYDLVYNPAETALMQLAQAAGLPVRGGLGMLVEQAIRSFELWTGQRVAPSILYQGISDFSLVNFRSKP